MHDGDSHGTHTMNKSRFLGGGQTTGRYFYFFVVQHYHSQQECVQTQIKMRLTTVTVARRSPDRIPRGVRGVNPSPNPS